MPFRTLARAQIPTVTNVNMLSVAAACRPSEHGVTGNSWLDPRTGTLAYMEDAELAWRRPSWEGRFAVLTVKAKLLGLLGAHAWRSAAAECPPQDLVEAVGPAPPVYSAESSLWVLEAALHVLEAWRPDLLFVATTDFVFHMHDPAAPEARHFVEALDEAIGRLSRLIARLGVTADHGMGAKTRRVDLEAALARAGVEGRVVPVIRDRYTRHHENLGGAAYVHGWEALEAIRGLHGVDQVWTPADAAFGLDLPEDRLGDGLVLAQPHVVFGAGGPSVALRSHGSAHEAEVPFFLSAPPAETARAAGPVANRDLIPWLLGLP
ncbi:MAG: alkaline phosphatase family protein [Planctomycetes bacterium]|nr:alkaline phosphatase family protein [Planctomycetota bacterium]